MSTPSDPPQYPQHPQGGSSGGPPSSGGSSAAPPPDGGGYTPPGQYPSGSPSPGGAHPETGGQSYTPPGQYPQAGSYGQYPQGGSYGQYPQGGYPPEQQYGQYPGGAAPAAPGYGGGGYGGGTAPAATRPREVDWSFYAWLGFVALNVLSLLLTFTQFDEIRQQARESTITVNGRPATPEELETAGTIAVVFAVLIALFFTLLPLLFIFLMRQGRNWARIVLAVIAGIGIIFGLIGLAAGGFDSALSLVSLLLLIAATVFMFHPKANPWFQKRPAY